MKRVIFTLASARSGTLFLRDVVRMNARDCACRHEPFFDWGNPTLFGPAIYDAFAGRVERIRARLLKKRDYIELLRDAAYLESSHAFLKSAYVAALDVFPELQLIHIVRDPIRVARSEAYRERWRRRVHAPFHFYKGDDGRRHFCWALTGNEEIFQPFANQPLSLFQWYLVQWIEIENRAMCFLEEHQLHDRCFTLHSPTDLNDVEKLKAMFDFFNLPLASPNISLGRPRNQSIGYRKTGSRDDDEAEFAQVLQKIPRHYLKIFSREPYSACDWSARFKPPSFKTQASAEIQTASSELDAHDGVVRRYGFGFGGREGSQSPKLPG